MRYALDEQRHRFAARSLPSDGRRAGYVERWLTPAAARREAAHLSPGFVELRRENRIAVWDHWAPPDDILTLKLTLDKPLAGHRILTAEGLPVPEHALFNVPAWSSRSSARAAR